MTNNTKTLNDMDMITYEKNCADLYERRCQLDEMVKNIFLSEDVQEPIFESTLHTVISSDIINEDLNQMNIMIEISRAVKLVYGKRGGHIGDIRFSEESPENSEVRFEVLLEKKDIEHTRYISAIMCILDVNGMFKDSREYTELYRSFGYRKRY